MLNAKNFGVPQNRERVFIVGYPRTRPRPKILPILQNDSPDQRQERSLKEITRNVSISQRVYDPEGISSTITGRGGGGGAKTGLYAIRAMTERRSPECREIRRKHRQETGKDWNPRRNRELVPRKDEHSNCLTARTGVEHLLTDGARIRRLTPQETERLQGFPDGWTAWGEDEAGNRVDLPDSARYKLTGNAVTTTVVEAIARRIKATLPL